MGCDSDRLKNLVQEERILTDSNTLYVDTTFLLCSHEIAGPNGIDPYIRIEDRL